MSKSSMDYPMRSNILVVDDSLSSLRLLAGTLKKQGYKVCSVPSAKQALKAAESDPPDLILLDIIMPEMDGYEVCRRLKENKTLKEIPVIFLSTLNRTKDIVKAFTVGGVDYVTKPFKIQEVKARVEAQLKLRQLQRDLEKHNRQLNELVQEQIKEISDSQMATIFSLAKLSESRTDETGKHLERIQTFCQRLAAKLREDPRFRGQIDEAFITAIFRASPLHDIGRVGIPDYIILKPGKLTPEEFEVMKTHTLIGAQTLEAVRLQHPKNTFVGMGIAIIRCHHEKWDGSGYPLGLSGKSIPLSARIIAVADVYDILRSKLCYKQPFGHNESVEIIRQGSGIHFDPHIVKAFLELQDEFRMIREKMEE